MTAFYDLSRAERVALTERAMTEGRTVKERWIALDNPEASPWSKRAEAAAAALADQDAIADLGCGTMTLERHLRDGTAYIPVDVVRRDERTIVCDFNVEAPPRTSACAVACLGLLEYVLDAPAFMKALGERYAVCVISYNHVDSQQVIADRRAHAWVNDYSASALETLFRAAGWTVEFAQDVDKRQRLWRLRR